ncbi:MAG: serine--tRNA ligase [Anaerolineae bacterium]|nr:serine--tRNA ligase [Thermoflexales bacterium]MDW8406602.1 serine--tRNA ligase [Anaerolineae bacterium]
MLDINLIRTQPEIVRQSLAYRGEPTEALDEIIALDAQRRDILKHSEQLRATRNAVSKEIGRMKDPATREARITEMRAVGDQIDMLESELKKIEAQLDELTAKLPNIPDPRVPVGPDEEHNVILRTVGQPRTFDFEPKAHWDLGPALGIIDFERGAKLAGSRFYVLNGYGARLQRALIAYMLDLHHARGYREVYLPFMVKSQTLFAAGQLPKFRDNLYHDAEEDFWMVPTAEVPLTNLHGDEILDAEQLPLWYCAYTPCFRREKMSAGKDVRGIKRGHQFDKVEMYKYCLPEHSDEEHHKMLADAEAVLQGLGLTYRVKLLCTGDLGFGMRMTYDLEVWAPGCNEWLEVSSVSNAGDFQARRANIKFRREKGAKAEFVHTLNGSGLALPRTMIAVIENYQQADGSVVVPEVLRKFVGVEVIRMGA